LGIPLLIRPSHIDEVVLPGEVPDAYLERIVEAKLEATLQSHGWGDAACALSADTVVLLDNEVLGKPADIADAIGLLTRLCGRVHVVKTRYALRSARGVHRARTIKSEVSLRSASTEEIERYARTGEGLDKAGAYAAQGIGAFLVQSIQGSYTNVVGLPACEVIRDLCELGLLPDFPAPAKGRTSSPSF
jgi:septum formation protein